MGGLSSKRPSNRSRHMAHLRNIAFGIVIAVAATLHADVKPAAIFSDHMVLQQGMSVPVWGWADPGEQVKVTIGYPAGTTGYPAAPSLPQTKTATAGADGKWMIRLDSITPTS